MTLVQKFKEKYGVNPIKLVEDANLKNFGLAKTLGLQKLLEVFVEDRSLKIEVNSEFLKDLVESFAEAKEKFPENVKASVDTGTKFEVANQMSGIPKSKGTLENFKDIVGTDDLRPVMMGVYVSEDGFIVGTDAHKLVKQKNNGLLSQTDYAGKTIDLTKYIKSKGKLIDFVDGVYPKYDAVIPRDTPYEDRALSTYAFYNYVKSALDVKRLVDAEIFNINLNLMTETSGETKMFSFAYHVLFDALNFAMLNNWDFFTLRYSEPTRGVVFDFGGDNIVLVMPIIDSYGASGGSTGTIPLTTEEVEEKYRAGLSSQKASKPKASKPVRPSAPVSSEPFKKFEGELSDTTYIHRSKIDSIRLVSGEVLGKNDVIDGFYRVNKKMARGGGVEPRNPENFNKFYEDLTDLYFYAIELGNIEVDSYTIPINERELKRLKIIISLLIKVSFGRIDLKMKTNFPQWVKDSITVKPTLKQQLIEDEYQILVDTIESKNLEKYAHGGSMYAGGGSTPNGKDFLLSKGYDFDGEVYFESDGEVLEVVQGSKGTSKQIGIYFHTDEPISISRSMLDKISSSFGKPFHIKLFTNAGVDLRSSENGKFKNISVERIKYAHGGSMYAGGGNMFEKPIAMYREVSGKTRNLPQSTEVYESEINRFIDYVHDFYEEEGYSKAEVKSAVNKYLNDLGNQDTYGGGDSIDREKVYKYLEKDSLEKSYKSGLITQGEYEQLKKQKENKYAHGGSMYAGGGLIAYANADMESEIGRFSSLAEAKKFAKANKWRYNTISFQDPNNDEILVSKDDSFQDIDWLFSGKMAHGGSMYADGGLIAYADGDMDSEIGRFSSLTEAKKFAKANKWRYNTMSFQDEKYDEILVSKDDSFQDIDWLFSGKMAHGSSTTHSYEAGDKVTFKSVMGGTKTGLIVSKLGEDGFRIKTEDGFATVKKSAIV